MHQLLMRCVHQAGTRLYFFSRSPIALAILTRVEVSVPYVAALVADTGGKYYMTPKHIEDATERHRYRHRGPTLRSLVKLALACQSAEQWASG